MNGRVPLGSESEGIPCSYCSGSVAREAVSDGQLKDGGLWGEGDGPTCYNNLASQQLAPIWVSTHLAWGGLVPELHML